jgi:hypothetical protein
MQIKNDLNTLNAKLLLKGVTNAFSLDGSTPANGFTDTYCTGDYIGISGDI